jgi:SRSO17 transposase
VPADDVWLLVRRSISNPAKLDYYLSNADESTRLEMLAHIASTRYTIEQCFEEGKDDVGLDQYEVRTWPSWHRFITLGMMALAWLASVRTKLPGEGRFPYAPAISPDLEHELATPAPGEKSPPLLTRSYGRRRCLPGAFPKSAA